MKGPLRSHTHRGPTSQRFQEMRTFLPARQDKFWNMWNVNVLVNYWVVYSGELSSTGFVEIKYFVEKVIASDPNIGDALNIRQLLQHKDVRKFAVLVTGREVRLVVEPSSEICFSWKLKIFVSLPSLSDFRSAKIRVLSTSVKLTFIKRWRLINGNTIVF
jgi:hypothetical protein